VQLIAKLPETGQSSRRRLFPTPHLAGRMKAKRQSQARKRVEQLAAKVDENPIELAKALWELENEEPGSLKEVVKTTGLGQRKAYYLRSIWERLGRLDIPAERLAEAGWLKLSILARHCKPGKERKGVALALKHTAVELPSIIQGAAPPRQKPHSVLLRLNAAQYKTFTAALLKFGAQPAGRGRGVAGKEAALIRALRAIK
jgi:hypothetical protein